VVGGSGSLHAEGLVGVLPVVGRRALAEALDQETDQALARGGKAELLGPQATRQRLSGAPGVDRALDRARRLIAAAERSGIFMRRAAAVTSSEEAIALLEAAGARYHAPRLLAQAHGALALALLLRPPDETRATRAFLAALQADPDFTLDPDRLTPRAALLLEEARSDERRAAQPSLPELDRLAARARVRQILWLSATSAKGRVVLEAVLHDREAQITHRHRRIITPGGDAQGMAGLLAEVLGLPRAASRDKGITTEVGHGRPSATPFYRRWWFWTAVAVVIGAGVGTAIGVSQASRGATPYEFRFRF
jgi:hypothetical protein